MLLYGMCFHTRYQLSLLLFIQYINYSVLAYTQTNLYKYGSILVLFFFKSLLNREEVCSYRLGSIQSTLNTCAKRKESKRRANCVRFAALLTPTSSSAATITTQPIESLASSLRFQKSVEHQTCESSRVRDFVSHNAFSRTVSNFELLHIIMDQQILPAVITKVVSITHP